MIEINLLPGSGKKSRRAGVRSGLTAMVSGVAAQVKDPFMIGAIASAVVCIGVVGVLWGGQKKSEGDLAARQEVALKDSVTYSTVILEKRRAASRRDSVLRQVRLIQTIDDDRYRWPHILAEVSKSVPPYTWLGEINFITPAVSPAAAMPVDSAALRLALTRADSVQLLMPKTDTVDRRVPIRFSIKGYTVDVQAMTQMMRDLETSPFIRGVTMMDSKALVEQETTFNEFTLEAEYQMPDSVFVKRTPIPIAGR